ncbi:MAG: hypothetical protein JWP91_253 [Fibrobacteres bacterium]|nr:hypothetical protein [Fibrobacterota bacterium]
MDLILITGGAGNMGRRLASALTDRGDHVRLLCLPDEPAATRSLLRPQNRPFETVYGDITRKETLAAALKGIRTVFHLAAVLIAPGREDVLHAVNAEGTRNMVDASEAAGVEHFIYVSSISVEYPASNPYARSKLQGEEWVRRSRLLHTIVRPSLAYEDGGALEFMRFVDHLKRGPVVFLPDGGRALKNPVHIEDLVAGFLTLPGNPRAMGKTYAFPGGEAISLRTMAKLLLAHMGRPKPVLGVPAWVCLPGISALRAWSRISGSENPFTYQTYTGLIQDAAPSHQSAREDLGYQPRPFHQGLATLASLRDCLRAA